MPVKIHGKEYYTVAERISSFRAEHNDKYGIVTDLVSNGEEIVVKAEIKDISGNVVATGYASEVRDSSMINKTSALENAETSAVGRALACFGLSGTEYASADELANALSNQKQIEALAEWNDYMQLVREHFETIAAIREGIVTGELDKAVEAWQELSDDDKKGLWRAPSKGGVFTTQEREVMKSDEWGAVTRSFLGG